MTTNYNYQKAKIGSLVLPQKQAISHPANLRNETNFYASASQASFSSGSYFVVDIKQKIQEIYNISLLFTVGDITTGLTFNAQGDPTEQQKASYHPSFFFFQE